MNPIRTWRQRRAERKRQWREAVALNAAISRELDELWVRVRAYHAAGCGGRHAIPLTDPPHGD